MLLIDRPVTDGKRNGLRRSGWVLFTNSCRSSVCLQLRSTELSRQIKPAGNSKTNHIQTVSWTKWTKTHKKPTTDRNSAFSSGSTGWFSLIWPLFKKASHWELIIIYHVTVSNISLNICTSLTFVYPWTVPASDTRQVDRDSSSLWPTITFPVRQRFCSSCRRHHSTNARWRRAERGGGRGNQRQMFWLTTGFTLRWRFERSSLVRCSSHSVLETCCFGSDWRSTSVVVRCEDVLFTSG